jgi:mono/diheme cytochrome c family protein
MKKVIHRKLSKDILRFGLIILLAFTTTLSAQDGDPVKGKSLFNANCAACHQLDKKMTGPALRHVEARLSDEEGLDRDWLNAWIRNSAGLIKSGDSYANKVYNEFGGAAMTAFPQLSDEDLNNLLAYTAEEKKAPPVPATAVGGAQASTDTSGISNELILGALGILFILLAAGLFLVNKTLRRFASAQNIELDLEEGKTPLWKAFVQNQFLMLVVLYKELIF